MNVLTWQFFGAAFTLIAGTLLHFVYGWSDRSLAMAPFAAVNESVWEHLKLLAVPMLLFAVVEYFCYGRALPGFLPARTASVLFGMAEIVVLFYTYVGIVGRNFLLADILVFCIGVAEAYLLGAYLLLSGLLADGSMQRAAFIALLLLISSLFFFTFRPPHIGLFRDPVTGRYGTAA